MYLFNCFLYIVIFNIVGLFAAFKKIYYLSITYAIYLYLISILLIANYTKSIFSLIPSVLSSLMSIIVSFFVKGLRERRFRATNHVAVMDRMQNIPYCLENSVFQLRPIDYPLHLTNNS
jgi:ABC-type proline/glycine betaine transport system permease subunit